MDCKMLIIEDIKDQHMRLPFHADCKMLIVYDPERSTATLNSLVV